VIVLLCLESPSPGRASRAALDIACTLAETASVVAISAGGGKDGPAIALARSCAALSRVVHIDDAALDQADFMTTGMVLAEAARRLEASFVLAGERSDDEGQGLVPAALSHHLHANLLSRVQAVRLSPNADTVEVTLRAGGQRCTVAAHAPLVLTTCAGLHARTSQHGAPVRDVETLSLASIGIDGSRLVPRPDLLGGFVPKPEPGPREMALAEACAALLRHR
jgi:electron transfer flavoprotein alpha/beta subunit